MHWTNKLLLSLCFLTASAMSAAEPPPSLAKPLESLRPFIGKSWKGEFKKSTPEKRVYDISKWERALNGQAVRITHSINNGEYGGETMIVWNARTERLEYYYFTTAGFFTQGTINFEDGKLITHELVTGNQNGVTEVKATTQIQDNGKMHVKSRYLQKGEWVDGHEVTYEETPGAEVIFK